MQMNLFENIKIFIEIVDAGSFAQAAERCVQIDSVSKPDPENHALYTELFRKYKAVHDALAPIYRG